MEMYLKYDKKQRIQTYGEIQGKNWNYIGHQDW